MAGSLNTASGFYAAGMTGWKVTNSLMVQSLEPEVYAMAKKQAWRPPQWNNLPGDETALSYIKTNIGQDTTEYSDEGTNSAPPSDEPEVSEENVITYYFFDAVLKEEHAAEVRMTEHPVQAGANITDHAFVMPATVRLEIGMSDVMGCLVDGSWDTGEKSNPKSKNAYQILLAIKDSREPLTVTTRLNTYENMIIQSLHVSDDYRTAHSLRCTISLREIIMADVGDTKTSSRKQASQSISKGAISKITPSVKQGTVLDQAIESVKSYANELTTKASNLVDSAKAGVSGTMDSAGSSLTQLTSSVTEVSNQSVGTAITGVGDSIPDVSALMMKTESVTQELSVASASLKTQLPSCANKADLLTGGSTSVLSLVSGINTNIGLHVGATGA